MRRALAAAGVLGAACTLPLRAQAVGAAPRRPDPGSFEAETAAPAGRVTGGHGARGPAWLQPLASLVAPGTGQLLGGHDRGAVYLATEVWVLTRAVELTREARNDRSAFKDLAFDVARAAFTAVRVDGTWDYYESMTHYVESGRFSLGAGSVVTPETDTLTFNGATWLLARRTYFENPDSVPDTASFAYHQALAFYKSRAVQPAFQWSWRNARLEQDVYRAEIRSSDDAFRQATNYLGALVFTHLGSAIDALITIRLGSSRPAVVPHVVPGTAPGELRFVWYRRF